MAATTVAVLDVTATLTDVLTGIDGLRVYAYPADTFRPPGVLIGQPSIDYQDPDPGFCRAMWDYDLTVAVARSSDREAWQALARWVDEITATLAAAQPAEVFSVDPVRADPLPGGVIIAGQDLPAYSVRVQVRA